MFWVLEHNRLKLVINRQLIILESRPIYVCMRVLDHGYWSYE